MGHWVATNEERPAQYIASDDSRHCTVLISLGLSLHAAVQSRILVLAAYIYTQRVHGTGVRHACQDDQQLCNLACNVFIADED